MPIWIVKATWLEDEAVVSEQWAVNASTVQDAVQFAATHFRYQPLHVEARRRNSEDIGDADLPPGQPRRVPPEQA